MRGVNKYGQKAISLSFLIVLVLPATWADPNIPDVASAVDSWFSQTITDVSSRKSTVDPNLVTAETTSVIIKVRKDGSGSFKTVQSAVDSVKTSNTARTIIDIGPGNYTEKIMVERYKPYITFLGDAKNKPILTFNGNASKYGTVDSASVIVMSDYFVASNIIFENTSPRPQVKEGGQALALRISGDKATFYNCRFLGFQDTICDDVDKHFFMNCYFEGTMDFLFGDGTSIYLNSEIHVVDSVSEVDITAQARKNEQDPGTYIIVHANVTGKDLTGTGGTANLGRSWFPSAKVVYLYSSMTDAICPPGWSDFDNPANEKTAYFAEYKCTGPGADLSKRVDWMKKLTDEEAKPFLTLDYIEAMKWLLPPPKA